MGLPPENTIDIGAALRLPTGDGVAEHVNNDVDVVIIVFEGNGELTVDGTAYPLRAGNVLVVPRGAERGMRCIAGPLVYLTCHRRRPGLMPS